MNVKLLSREQLAKRAAAELRAGMYVNLGIGIPTLVANEISPEMNITLQWHSRHGAISAGGF
jgi:acyl CoA:acetate/3-ketoacid CoA transferase beta subunit